MSTRKIVFQVYSDLHLELTKTGETKFKDNGLFEVEY
jgi:hypothetical protein